MSAAGILHAGCASSLGTAGEPGSPLFPDIGVLAVTDDRWDGLWTTRHFLLHHLSRFFRIGWLEPMAEWKGISRHSAHSVPAAKPAVKSVVTAGPRGIAKCEPLSWVPDFYRPHWLRLAVRSRRYTQAASFLRQLGCKQVVLYLWRPSYADALDSRKSFDAVIYHIDDEYSFADVASPLSAGELQIIRDSDGVIVHSPGLAERKGGINPNTYTVPNGVDYRLYARPHSIPADLASIPKPRIGYTGVIKKQLDIGLMRQIAERRPAWSLVLIGPVGNLSGQQAQFEELSKLPNVHLLGHKEVSELPAYQQHFDAAIMPYVLNAYTDCIYPLKLHEYLAAGRPVIATPVRTLQQFSNVVSLERSVEGWISAIHSAVSRQLNTDELVAARRAIAARHDWPILAGRTAGIMLSHLGSREKERILKNNFPMFCEAGGA